MKDVLMNSNENKMKMIIPEEKNVIIDLNGYKIIQNNIYINKERT